jgi:signal transduction histidine kinase
MTSDVSHDLRTPITAILGTLELIESGTLAPTPERIRTARREAERLARMVDNLHTLALADAGELPVQLTAVSVRDILSQTATAFEAKAAASGVDVVFSDSDSETAHVYADHDRLAQVLANLVANAVRHTPSGGRVVLSSEPSPAGIQIVVRDTGAGIPEAVLPTVFERSVRADQARSGDGAGLGLSIVKSLVEAMGGTVDLGNDPGGGAVATIRLPAAPA